MAKRYHSLLVRDNAASPWGIHFGDYDREVVDAERDDITDGDYRRSNTKIITTDDAQAAIDAAVSALNGKG